MSFFKKIGNFFSGAVKAVLGINRSSPPPPAPMEIKLPEPVRANIEDAKKQVEAVRYRRESETGGRSSGRLRRKTLKISSLGTFEE
jgi:hypothetical protein